MSGHDFTGKHVVITGASRGLGRAFAEAFAQANAHVVLVARASADLDALAAALRARGQHAQAMPCDVTDHEEVARLFSALERCDVLVNNAGTNRPQPFLDVDLDALDTILELNVRSAFLVAQAAARRMAQVRAGVIVNVSSQMGHVGGPNRSVYCLSKHAIEGLTKAMALDLAAYGIRVNSVAPTYIETAMTKPFLQNEAFRADVIRRIPLGRVGTVEEVANAVLFLASAEASLINGTSLLVDGGYTAQ